MTAEHLPEEDAEELWAARLREADQSDRPVSYSLTDDGNALRLVDAHEQELRYVPERALWLEWDGSRWRWDTAGRVFELAKALHRSLPSSTTPQAQHRRYSLSARGLRSCIDTARTDRRVSTPLDSLDAKPFELNTPGGVIDLRTGLLHQPTPKALHTRSTTLAPDFAQPTPVWDRFRADTFAGDPDLDAYVQRLLGLSLIGRVLEQVLPFAYGEGANGKTTMLGTVQRIVGLGSDGYAQAASADMLLATAHAGHPTELARLAGARIVVTSELEDGQRFAEARVKQLTGRDAISARFMRQDAFDFTPTHSLWLLANHMPAVRAGGQAFWRRVRLLPFLHVVPPEQRDPHLEDRLVEQEGPGILAWLARGAADYLTHGLNEPASVLTATRAYETDQDTVGRFVDELCTVGDPTQPHLTIKIAQLRTTYERWCHSEGETPVSAKALTRALRDRYSVQDGRARDARFYRGITLHNLDLEASPDPAPEQPQPSRRPPENW
ncbi:MAG: hypothetical protein JWL79_3083 [Frankiales bacterium]|nr:hypothetical protein [Frankiales bacterium]